MKYSLERPTKTGHYWYREGNMEIVLYLLEQPGGYCYIPGGQSVTEMTGYFAGPIPKPKMKEGKKEGREDVK